MKKLLYFLFICSLCMGFVSCGGDDEPEPEPEKPFTWNGDWNDPNDKNYKPEGYNPIEGVWQLEKDKTRGFRFSNRLELYIVSFLTDGKYTESLNNDRYEINDTAYRSMSIIRYKLIDGKLYIYPHQSKDDNMSILIKIK